MPSERRIFDPQRSCAAAPLRRLWLLRVAAVRPLPFGRRGFTVTFARVVRPGALLDRFFDFV